MVISPARYSLTRIGAANTLRKLRDQTSSKKAVVIPCITRVRKSHSSTAPSSAGTKLKLAWLTWPRNLVMKPHSSTSSITQTNSGSTRCGLPA